MQELLLIAHINLLVRSGISCSPFFTTRGNELQYACQALLAPHKSALLIILLLFIPQIMDERN